MSNIKICMNGKFLFASVAFSHTYGFLFVKGFFINTFCTRLKRSVLLLVTCVHIIQTYKHTYDEMFTSLNRVFIISISRSVYK